MTSLKRFWRWSATWSLAWQVAFALVVILVVAAIVGALIPTSAERAATSIVVDASVKETTTTSVSPTSTEVAAPPATTAPQPHTNSKPPALTIAPASHEAAYNRDLFGGDWIDVDNDCQNTRAEVLIAESSSEPILEGCTVFAGAWDDPWSTEATTNASDLDVDHTVPLANAWRSGAWAWDGAKRIAFANDLSDPDHLNAIPLSENRSKGDDGPEAWRPPDESSWCHYAQAWTRIKARWNLTATRAEWDALAAMSKGC